MIEVVQAFDPTLIARIQSHDRTALDREVDATRKLFASRSAWLKAKRIDILPKADALKVRKREHLGAKSRAKAQAVAVAARWSTPEPRSTA